MAGFPFISEGLSCNGQIVGTAGGYLLVEGMAQDSGSYFLRLSGEEVRRFPTRKEAEDYAIELAQDDAPNKQALQQMESWLRASGIYCSGITDAGTGENGLSVEDCPKSKQRQVAAMAKKLGLRLNNTDIPGISTVLSHTNAGDAMGTRGDAPQPQQGGPYRAPSQIGQLSPEEVRRIMGHAQRQPEQTNRAPDPGEQQWDADPALPADAEVRGGGMSFYVGKLPKRFDQSRGSWAVFIGSSDDGPIDKIFHTEQEAVAFAKERVAAQEQFVSSGGLRNFRMPTKDADPALQTGRRTMGAPIGPPRPQQGPVQPRTQEEVQKSLEHMRADAEVKATPKSFWSYQAASATPSLSEAIAAGAIASGTSQSEWDKLTPGMKREIVRSKKKDAFDAVGGLPDNIERLRDGRINVREAARYGVWFGSSVPKVGEAADYYDRSGDKKYGRVQRASGNTFWIDGLKLQFLPESARG